MKKANSSNKITALIFFALFALMLISNTLTPLIVDDFSFHYDLVSKEPITNFSKIFSALVSHAQHENGRLVAHFFVYLFELLPKAVFNFANAFIFVLQVVLIYKICKGEYKNNLLLMGIFGSIWMFEPSFGQVNLWIPGSCNYLWCVVFGLLFVLPFINDFLFDKKIKNSLLNILHIIIALMAGAWLENGSAPFIFIAVVLTLLLKIYQKKKISLYRIISIGMSIIGYLSIYLLSTGEFKNKSAEISFWVLRENFIAALEMYRKLLPLLISVVILFVMAIILKADKNKVILSFVFLLGSLCSNFMMTIAAYYPERCAICATVLLIVSNGILFQCMFESDYKVLLISAIAVLMLLTSYNVMIGLNDIYVTYSKIKTNEAYILECKEKGITDVTVQMFSPETKYSPAQGLRYLSSETPDTWPNTTMSRYYGVSSISGKW